MATPIRKTASPRRASSGADAQTPDEEKHWQVSVAAGLRTSYRRRSLANWITDTDTGAGALLARVIVNRLWQHHLGTGIVATPSDFGYQGDKPTHPELLEWLAQELLDNGWHLKPIHKRIMMSAVYMQGTQYDKVRSKIDDEDRYYWRRALAAAGGRNHSRQPARRQRHTRPEAVRPWHARPEHEKAVDLFLRKRSQLNSTMVLFDGPDALLGASSAITTTIAPAGGAAVDQQSLRAPLCRGPGEARCAAAEGKAPADAVTHAYLVALGRKPTARAGYFSRVPQGANGGVSEGRQGERGPAALVAIFVKR